MQDRQTVIEDIRQQLADGTMTLGEAIRRLRTQVTGLNQANFAMMCKLSMRTVRLLEQDVANPTVETLNSVFKLFGMQVGIVPLRRTPIKLSD
jgi:transcriptional regulator with XRE-family HTH domain